MTVLFRANFQNTLTPEVGTYDNTSEKTGSFGLEGGEYYLQNSPNTKGYYFYYLASGSDNSKLTITFNIAIIDLSSFGWSVLFSGSDSNWWGLFTNGNSFSLNTKSGSDTSLGSYSTSTWYTVKITQEVSLDECRIKLYIDDVEKADISRATTYAITNLLLLGNTSTSWAASGTVLKNVLITDGEEEEEEPTPSGVLKYLNLTGLSNLVTNIKNWVTARIPTKTSEITNDSGYITSSSLPTVNNATLTIQKNGTNVQTFTANASSNKTANITVPTAVSELTNDSGFITSSSLPTVNNAKLTIQKNGTTVKTFTANASSNVTCNITVPTAVSELTNDSGYLTAHQAVTNSAPTLSWGTTSTIGSVGGTDLTVTMPANPNTDTDTKVTQTVTTGSTLYPVIVGNTASATATETSGVRFSSKLLMNTRYGYLRGLSYDSDNLKGVAPSDTRTCGGSIQFYTYDGTESGRLWNEVLADGSRQTYIRVTNYITNGALATDGTATYTLLRLRVYPTGAKKIYCDGGWENNLIPDATNARTLGTSSLAWKSVYAQNYYLGTTAFGDIVTHNASEFLTSHQSLSNYSTLANTVKSLSISGKTITVTPGSGSAYTLTTQDTTYSNFVKSGSGAKAGLVPAPSTTAGTTKYLREDGTWQVPPDHTYTVNNATLTIQKNGSNVATFTSNASSNVTANITVPTKTSELTNDSGFLTSHQSLAGYLPLTGGTLTGSLTFKKSSATRGTAPSSDVTFQHCDTKDSANNRITLIETTYYTDMSSKVALFAYKTTAASGSNIGSIGIGCTSSGTVYTFAPTPAANDNTTKIATTAWVQTFCGTTKGYLTSHQSLANYVTLNGAQTISGGKTFSKSFGDGDPSVLIQSDTAYANGTWNYPLAALAPNMKAGANLFMPIGRNFAAGNCAGWRWNYAGNNSNDNYVSVEFYAVGSHFAVYRDGRVMLSASPAASDNSTRVATTAFVKAQGYTTSAASKKLVLLAERSEAGTWTITCDTLKPIYFKFTASKNDSNAEFVVGIDGSSTCRLVNVNHGYSTNQFSYQVTNTSSGGQATWGIGVPTSSTITVSVWLRNTQFQRHFNIKAYQ